MAKQSQILDCYVDWRNTELQLVLTREQFESYDLKRYFYLDYAFDTTYEDDKTGEKYFQTFYDARWVVPSWKIGYLYKKDTRKQVELYVFACMRNRNFVDIVIVARSNKVINKDFQRKHYTDIKILEYYTRVESVNELFKLISNAKFLEPIKNAAREFGERVWDSLKNRR